MEVRTVKAISRNASKTMRGKRLDCQIGGGGNHQPERHHHAGDCESLADQSAG